MNQLMREDELLTCISNIDSYENAIRYKNEFNSVKHEYSFEHYLNILERVKSLILKGINDVDEVIAIINAGADNLIRTDLFNH